jgi:hypothetical protein
VVVACAFQMLCPGCVSHAIPQLKAVYELFAPLGAVVVGLHTVFEHHEAMTTTALRAFLHESSVRIVVASIFQFIFEEGLRVKPIVAAGFLINLEQQVVLATEWHRRGTSARICHLIAV